MFKFHIDSDQGRIGKFWWINSNFAEPLYMGNISPWVKRYCIRWGTFGYAKEPYVYMQPISFN